MLILKIVKEKNILLICAYSLCNLYLVSLPLPTLSIIFLSTRLLRILTVLSLVKPKISSIWLLLNDELLLKHSITFNSSSLILECRLNTGNITEIEFSYTWNFGLTISFAYA